MIISLQYLRGIAAMMVVAFHASELLARMNGGETAFTVGLAGVDIFFVISGFIMWVIADTTDPTPAQFIRKRLIRVVPLYWLLTLFLASVAIVMPSLLKTSVFEPAHFLASMLFFPWHHPNVDALVPLLIPGWTLNYEMAFYALFTFGLVLPKSWRLGFMLTALATLAAFGLTITTRGAASFYTDPIILEFGLGIIVGRLWTRGIIWPAESALVVLILGSTLLYLGAGSTLPRIVSLGLPACMIVSGFVSLEGLLARHVSATLARLGDASYSIYLSHVIVLAAFAKIWSIAGMSGSGASAMVFIACALAGSALAGSVLYLTVEKPLLNWMSGKRRRTAKTGPQYTETAMHVPGE